MSENKLIYSIQQTYIIKPVSKFKKQILTCEQRIDIPTIEPLTDMKAVVYSDKFSKIIPCIELAGKFLDEFKLTFETNEGVTVLPIKIYSGSSNPLDNPYTSFRYVLVLPRGATGVKSCKIIDKATGKEVQHNFTFGIMPPPYNYDNALFGYLSYGVNKNHKDISDFRSIVSTAFENLQYGLYKMQVQNSVFPMTSSPIPENRSLSMIKFRVKNKTGAKAVLELEFTYRTADNSKGNDVLGLHIADGDNTVIIDIDKGMLIVVSDRTGSPFMASFPCKHEDHVITALNKASIYGDTTSGLINYNYYFKPNVLPQV
jgi:hypothetical protein|nr:MAG TPA: hypothetical protein [Caudoviricetes sp.]